MGNRAYIPEQPNSPEGKGRKELPNVSAYGFGGLRELASGGPDAPHSTVNETSSLEGFGC